MIGAFNGTQNFMTEQGRKKIAQGNQLLEDVQNNPQNASSTRSAAAALVSLGLQAINGIAGDIAQSSAQQKQLEATQDTNATNYKIWQEQLAYAREQYQRELEDARQDMLTQRNWSIEDRDFENKYNSPLEQVKRYREAGLNPYLMMNGQNAVGSISADIPSRNSVAMSMPGAPQMQVPNYGIASQGNIAMLGNMTSLFGQMADLAFQRDKMDQDWIITLNNDKYLSPETKNEMIKHRMFLADERDNTLANFQAETFTEKWLNNAYQRAVNEFADEQFNENREQFKRNAGLYKKTIEQLGATISNLGKQGKLYDQEGEINDKALELLEKEIREITRYEDSLPDWAKSFISIIDRFLGGGAGKLLNLIKKR